MLICEGDSWFNHPFLKDIPEQLHDHLGFTVLHSNCPGKLLSDSVSEAHFLAPLRDSRKSQIKALLLSGGGNDVINYRRPDDSSPSPIFRSANSSDPDAYIDAAQRDAALDEMVGLLKQVAHLLAQAGVPDLPVLLHGYDHIVPHQYGPSPIKGSWVKPQLDLVGATDPALQKAITQRLQARWMEVYRHACRHLGWSYVDLEGCAVNGWFDEIHLKNEGFYQAALRFETELAKYNVRPTSRIEALAA